MCGGTQASSCRDGGILGLSPRVRGNRHALLGVLPPGWSIPACAGEPGDVLGIVGQRGVYPRVCGGTLWRRAQARRRRGLSPRVRGNQPGGGRVRGMQRSIPACAGEPGTALGRIAGPEVYPRVCGGTPAPQPPPAQPEGLSPRVRGNLTLLVPQAGIEWSIPACAGEPHRAALAVPICRVYPRVCGGTKWAQRRQCMNHGLSPRVRGNLESKMDGQAQARSIPACAGEPSTLIDTCGFRLVYPRVCGGTFRMEPASDVWKGLSPRVRGNRRLAIQPLGRRGSIPACAGEPAAGLQGTGPGRVYPRVCGGTNIG